MKKATRKPRRKPAAKPYVLRPGHVLMLRTSDAQRRSAHTPSFVWPESGPVSAPDWNKRAECGHGLHGYLWGASANPESILWGDATWQVVDVVLAECVDLSGKWKFPRGVVVFSGDRAGATAMIAKHAPAGTSIIGGTATAGDGGTATAGDGGTATAGDGGTATAGVRGTATAGVRGTATAGDGGTISVRYYDPKREKYRVAVAEVGEAGILPDTAYVVADGKLVRKGGK